MHELVFAEEILHTVETTAEEHKANKINHLKLQIGKYAGIDQSSLLFCLESIATGTPMEGAKIDIEEISSPSLCPSCGSTAQDDTTPGICPNCGAMLELNLIHELRIQEIELDVDEN